MNGQSALIWLGLAAVAGAVLFETSYEVQGLEEELAALNRRIVQEQEAIQVLRAEWSFLNDPTRIETLARTHLDLKPAEARQFLTLDAIPFRPAPMPAPGGPAPDHAPYMASVRVAPIAPMPTAHTPAATVRPAAPTAKPPAARARSVAPPAPRLAAGTGPVAAATTDAMGVLIARLGDDR